MERTGPFYHERQSHHFYNFPTPKLPNFSLSTITKVLPTSISIAVLAAIESLLSAVVADGMIGAKHNSNNELIGQGIANIFSPLFGGLPATGAIARTATNINNGGRTPVAGIVHAVILLLIMLFFGSYVEYIPLPALAAVLMSVAWNMAGLPAIRKLLKGQKSDICVLTVTFLITVFIDLTYAILIGLAFAAFFFIKKMIDLSEVETTEKFVIAGISGDGSEETIDIPKGVIVYEIEGPLFFGTVIISADAGNMAADFKLGQSNEHLADGQRTLSDDVIKRRVLGFHYIIHQSRSFRNTFRHCF